MATAGLSAGGSNSGQIYLISMEPGHEPDFDSRSNAAMARPMTNESEEREVTIREPIQVPVKRDEVVIPKKITAYKPKKEPVQLQEVSYQAPAQSKRFSVSDGNSNNRANSTRDSMGNGIVEGGASPYFTPKPPYPPAARRVGFEGRVVLDLVIGIDGRPKLAEVRESSGRQDCDDSARKTILDRWRFEPCMQAGTPVESRQQVAVRYQLQ